jgi:uncharacterized damage-inducible protein DinB
MNYNFTDRLRKILALARDEAMALQHDYVGTEHLLLGLIEEGEGVAAAVLMNLSVDFDRIREIVFDSVRKGSSPLKAGELPYTSRGKKVLEYSMMEAREWNHPYVGSEHLLLGLLREETGIAAQVLNSLGVTLDNARAEIGKLLSADQVPVSSVAVENPATQMSGPAPTRSTDAQSRLLTQLRATYYGPSWHGPTLRELLSDTAEQAAAAHPIANAHSIWEIVLHSAAWKRVVTERLTGQTMTLAGEDDWPPVTDTSRRAWETALADLDAAHESLTSRVRLLDNADLSRKYPPDQGSFYSMIHGIMQHDIYHAGQVALLKKKRVS